MERLWITGVSGLLGGNFARLKSQDYDLFGSYLSFPLHRKTRRKKPSREKPFFPFPLPPERLTFLDLRDEQGLAESFERIRPDIILHTAAVTDPGDAEKDPGRCWEVNVQATASLAELCRRRGARLVFLSTDIVYDGLRGWYSEDDPPSPLHVYGRSKVEAENILLRRNPDTLAIRTSIMLGRSPRGTRSENERILMRLLSGEAVRLFTDEFRCFIWVDDLALAIQKLLAAGASGLFHVVGPERLSRFELGQHVLRACRRKRDLLIPTSLAGWAGSPPRAPDVSLDISQLLRTVDLELHTAEEALKVIYR